MRYASALGLAAASFVALQASPAAAGISPTSCFYDSVSAQLNVQIDGTHALSIAKNSISLDGVLCGAATAKNTDTIVVNGNLNNDSLTITGVYGPGKTAEGAGVSEIEITINLGGGDDSLTMKIGNLADTAVFTAGGVDLNGDGDEDWTVNGPETYRLYGKGGDDIFDASAYTDTIAYATRLYLYGDDGADTLTGSDGQDYLLGGAGDDDCDAGAGNDYLYGYDGNDVLEGGLGMDKFYELTAANGGDTFIGGADKDTVYYNQRSNPISLTIGAGANDGESGELDDVGSDIENVYSGSGDDILIGNDGANILKGGGGNDNIEGGVGIDSLYGEGGDDVVNGGDGADKLFGGDGNDSLVGGTGKDVFDAGDGNDNLYNNDGQINETVNCGAGASDAAVQSEADLFTGCEFSL